MPIFDVQDDNGNTLTLEGDSPPDEQELEDLFAQHHGPTGNSRLPGPQPIDFNDPGFQSVMQKQFDAEAQRKEYGRGQEPGTEFTQALFNELPADIGRGLEKTGTVIYEKGVNTLSDIVDPHPDVPGSPGEFPTETAIQSLPPVARAYARGGEGLVKSAPQMAIAAVDPLLGAAAFGFTPQGFSPKQAIIAAALPVVGKYTGAVVEAIATKAGVSSDVAQMAFNKMGGASGAAGLIAADQAHEISKLPPDQQKEAWIDAAGNVGSMFLLGTLGERKKLGGQNASKIGETETVHGDVRRESPGQAEQPGTQVPTEEGGQGIQSQAEGGILSPEQYNQLPVRELPLRKPKAPTMEHGQLLDEADAEYLRKESEGLDVGVDVTKATNPDEPFHRMIATPDRATGRIRINPDEFKLWLADIPEAQRPAAVKSLLAEERIHLATKDEQAGSYWNALSGAEKAIAKRVYTGSWSGKYPGLELTDTHFGHESLRRRIQTLQSLDPTEIAAAVGREKWTIKGLDALDRTISGIREAIGTKASKEQLGILDKVQDNIGVARKVIQSGVAAGALRRNGKETDEVGAFVDKLADRSQKVSTDEAVQAGLKASSIDDLNSLADAWRSWKEDLNTVKAAARQDPSKMGEYAALAQRGQIYREAIEAATNSGSHRVEARVLGEKELPRPKLDHETNPEVEAWLRKNGPEVGIRLPEAPQQEAAALRRRKEKGQPVWSDDRLNEQYKKLAELSGGSPERINDEVDSFLAENESHLAEINRQIRAIEKMPDAPESLKQSVAALKHQASEIKDFEHRVEHDFFESEGGEKPPEIVGALRRKSFRKADDDYEQSRSKIITATDAASARKEYDDQARVFREKQQQSVDVLKSIGARKQDGSEIFPGQWDFSKVGGWERNRDLADAAFKRLQDYSLAKRQLYRDYMDKWGEQTVGALRRGGPSKRGQEIADQKRRILEMQARARGEELPPELQSQTGPVAGAAPEAVAPQERVGPGAGGAPAPEKILRTPADFEAAAKEVIESPISGDVKSIKPGTETEAEKFRTDYDRPSFEKFVQSSKVRGSTGWSPSQLRDMWQDVVWNHLTKASPERLAEWRKGMGLEANYGTIRIAGGKEAAEKIEAQRFSGEGSASEANAEAKKFNNQVQIRRRQDLAGIESSQRYRNKLIAAIGRRLINESTQDRPSLDRREVTADDLAYDNTKADGGAYRELTQRDVSNPKYLGKILSDQARFSMLEPESHSKRLVAVVDPNGKVELLSTYNDAGVQRVTDPSGARLTGKPSRVLDKAFLYRYRPFATLLLSDPVKGFRKQFDSVSDFNDQIGREARNRATVGEELQTSTPETFEAEGTPGLEGEGGGFVGPFRDTSTTGGGRRAMESGSSVVEPEARAIFDSIEEAVGQFDTSNDVWDGLVWLKDKFERGKLTKADKLAINGYRKIFDSISDQYRDLDEQQLLNKMAETIYENHKTSQGMDEFVSKTLAKFPGRNPENAGRQPAPEGPRGKELTMPLNRIPPTVVRPEQLPPYAPKIERRPSPPAELGARINQIADRIEGVETGALRRNRGRTIGEMTKNVLSDFGGIYDKWMVDRLDEYGGPESKKAAAGFRHIIDREKQLYGQLTPLLDRARRLAGGIDPGNATTIKGEIGELPARAAESARALRTANWLNKIDPVTPNTGVANTVSAIEGKVAVPPWAQNTVDAAKAANMEIGAMLQPVIPGFKATGKFQRNFTSLGYDIIKQGGGRLWDEWTKGIAAANLAPGTTLPIMTDRVRTYFRALKRTLDDPAVSGAVLEKINQDMARRYPEAITHVKGSLGRWQEVVHSNLFNYLENAARRATHVRAFREQFPATDAGRKAFADTISEVKNELPDAELHRDVDALVKSMHGHPTDDYNGGWHDIFRLGPQQVGGQALQFMNQTVGNVLSKMVLTGQMFVQPGENIAGSTPVFMGYPNYLKALARYRQLYPTLELEGSVNRIMRDYTFNPNAPLRSSARILGNVISKGAAEAALNELQEGMAAATARVVSENIVTGNLSPWEKSMLPQTFKVMGFNPGEVQRLMQGDQELLGQFQRKAAAFLTGGNKAISEGSRLGANRMFNSIFRFQSYPMIKSNQLRRTLVNLADAWQTGTPAEKKAATALTSRFLFGNAMQGALTVGLTALAYGGMSGLKVRMNEAKDEPGKFMTESMLSSMSGPLYLLWRGAKQKGIAGVGEQAMRAAFPYAMMNDLNDMVQGSGQYKDLDNFDKIGKFLKNKTPGTQAISTGLAMFGLGNPSQPLEEALKGLGRWKRDELGYATEDKHLNEDERARFRMEVKKAIEAMKDGDQSKFMDHWMNAAGEKDVKTIGQSLRSRRVLVGPDGKALTEEQKESLQKRIGFEAYDRLEYYDLMLEQAAKGVLLPQD